MGAFSVGCVGWQEGMKAMYLQIEFIYGNFNYIYIGACTLIRGFDDNSLAEKINQLLSPSDPIRSAEHLQGRANNLRDISRNLTMI